MSVFDCDVLIAGGGLVGGSLALALARSPLRVILVEAQSDTQRREASAGLRALALADGSVQVLRRLGVWPGVEPNAAPIRHIHVSDRGHFGKTRLHADTEGVAALGFVARARDIEDPLNVALRESSIRIINESRLIGLQAGRDRICATLRQGGTTLNLTARLVVGADGGDSSVRKLLDIGQTSRNYGQTAMVFEVRTELDHRDTAFERFTASGPLALLPVGPRHCSVIWTLSAHDGEALQGLPDSDFLARLQDAFGHWLGRLDLTTRRQSFPLSLIQAARMTHQRVVLIGNAAHQLHPVAGQGFNLGLRDAAQLAEALASRHAFGEDIGQRRFLDSYAASRKRDLRDVVYFTDGLVRLFSNPFPPLALARNLGLLALDCWPGAKHLLARRAMGLARRIPRLS